MEVLNNLALTIFIQDEDGVSLSEAIFKGKKHQQNYASGRKTDSQGHLYYY